MTQTTPKKVTSTGSQYFSCPGCFHWTAEKDGEYFAIGELDDKKSYTLCPRCATIISNQEIAKPHLVKSILETLVVHATWSTAL